MSIELTPFDPKKQSAKNVTRVTLRGHKAYCVNDHGLAMLVPLAAGHVLHVIAPCPIASGFASKALARLYPLSAARRQGQRWRSSRMRASSSVAGSTVPSVSSRSSPRAARTAPSTASMLIPGATSSSAPAVVGCQAISRAR